MARNRRAAKAAPPQPEVTPLVDIPDEEKWRMINATGILKRAAEVSPGVHEREEEEQTLGDEIFDALLLIIPFSFLLMLMEILIHHQYGRRVSVQAILDRMLPSIPILSVFIFYTARYKQYRKMQIFLFVLGSIASFRTLWLVSRASWLVNMKQCPPMITIWIYTIQQMNLGPAVLNLALTGLYVWVMDLKPFR
ncbi:hypothetical protein HGRIS_009775 [Hohenbuehelia grisea]|uniref:DUF7719 domain-containing protein n=1 Tax=Hohenbuehelia grisea TaxID=104357 RepID=A0ABR3J3M4_9AGAR